MRIRPGGERSVPSAISAGCSSRICEKTIRSAQSNGIIHNDVIAYETAARLRERFRKTRKQEVLRGDIWLPALESRWQGAAIGPTTSAPQRAKTRTKPNKHERCVGRTAGYRHCSLGIRSSIERDVA